MDKHIWSGKINGASVEVDWLDTSHGSYYFASAYRDGEKGINTNKSNWRAARDTALKSLEIKINARKQREKEIKQVVDTHTPIVKWVAFENPTEDEAHYKAHFSGLQKRVKLSISAKVFGFFAAMTFIALFGLLLQFIASLSS